MTSLPCSATFPSSRPDYSPQVPSLRQLLRTGTSAPIAESVSVPAPSPQHPLNNTDFFSTTSTILQQTLDLLDNLLESEAAER